MSYVANGTYGCVFKPAVPCMERKGRDQGLKGRDAVSKVFGEKAEADQEERTMQRILKKIDPRGLFTIRSFGTCPVSRDAFAAAEISRCDNLRADQSQLHQIVYENGGMPISKVPWPEFWTRLDPLFAGIETLQSFRLVHQDIKPENVVFNTRTGKIALIDFGLCKPMRRVFGKTNAMMAFYLYMPPEMAANTIRHGWVRASQEAQKRVPMDNLKDLLKYAANPPQKLNHGLEKRLRSLEYKDDGDLDPFLIDSYMLGATILEASAGHVDMRGAVGKGLAELICGMLHPDMRQRWTIQKARAFYSGLVGGA